MGLSVWPGVRHELHPELLKIMAVAKNVTVIRSRIFFLIFMRSS